LLIALLLLESESALVMSYDNDAGDLCGNFKQNVQRFFKLTAITALNVGWK
jgi:hypothetical protein